MNIKKFTVITIAVITLLSMASCGKTDEPSLLDSQTGQIDTNANPGSLLVESQEPATIMPLTKEQVEGLYKEAVRVWGWYADNGMDVDESDVKEYNGYKYVRVNDNDIKTVTDLENHVRCVFGDDIAKQRLSDTMKFRDIDGNLYTLFSDGGSLIGKERKSNEVLAENDTKVIYRITANIVEDKDGSFEVTGEEVYDVIFEYIDGIWRCIQFEYIPIV